MQALCDFEPRLAGPVLSGTATVTSGIELHLFAVGAEAVAAQLADMGLTASTYERRMRFGGGRSELVPGFKLNYSGERTILLVFPEHGLREAPLSQVDRRPLQRASLRKLARLMDAD